MLLHVPVPVPCVSVHLEERKPVHSGLGNWENAVSEGLLRNESLQHKGPNTHPQPHQPAKASDGNYSESHPLLLPSRGAFHPSRLAVGRIQALPSGKKTCAEIHQVVGVPFSPQTVPV